MRPRLIFEADLEPSERLMATDWPGIVLIAVGLGMIVLLTYAGDVPRQAIGIGGFIVILGLGFFVNSLFAPHPTLPPRSNEPPTSPGSGS